MSIKRPEQKQRWARLNTCASSSSKWSLVERTVDVPLIPVVASCSNNDELLLKNSFALFCTLKKGSSGFMNPQFSKDYKYLQR